MHNTVVLKNGSEVPAIGLGTWYLGESPSRLKYEQDALWAGLEGGARLIDTAEMYGSGRSEKLVGSIVSQTKREDLYLVSKVLPINASRRELPQHFYRSLERMQTDYLDLYLLHWRGVHPFAETVEAMEALVAEGVLGSWGVSNLDLADMEELWDTPPGENCQVDQVLYHLASRGIEVDLQPKLREKQVAVMAYCPLAQGGTLREGKGLLAHPAVVKIAQARGISSAQVLLAWTIRDGHTIAIPRSASAEHSADNVKAMHLELSAEELAQLDAAFPAPTEPVPLDLT